jgi:dihydroorotase
MISPGFVDMRTSLRDPGFEYKETLETAAKAAAAGGFTAISCLPNTHPVLQSKADIEFVKRKASDLPVAILPYAAITRNREGLEMNELYDAHLAGAVAFSDGNKALMHAGVMERALEYSTIFDGLVISHAEDKHIAGSGMMHEGPVNTHLGLKGIPNIAEELMVSRDIELAKYTRSRLHFSHLSSKGSIELVRKAKKQGFPVSCDVAVANLVWTDEALNDFDSNFKLSPPLRSKADQKALWDGINDGTVDCIVTDHQPEDVEHKDVEFEYASTGMIQLQTAFSLLLQSAPKYVEWPAIVNALTANPRKILKQEAVSIVKGNIAELVVYQPKEKWEYNQQNNKSRSRNSPVLNTTLTGKVTHTITRDKLYSH